MTGFSSKLPGAVISKVPMCTAEQRKLYNSSEWHWCFWTCLPKRDEITLAGEQCSPPAVEITSDWESYWNKPIFSAFNVTHVENNLGALLKLQRPLLLLPCCRGGLKRLQTALSWQLQRDLAPTPEVRNWHWSLVAGDSLNSTIESRARTYVAVSCQQACCSQWQQRPENHILTFQERTLPLRCNISHDQMKYAWGTKLSAPLTSFFFWVSLENFGK